METAEINRLPFPGEEKVVTGGSRVTRLPFPSEEKVVTGGSRVTRLPFPSEEKVVTGGSRVTRLPFPGEEKVVTGGSRVTRLPFPGEEKVVTGGSRVTRLPFPSGLRITQVLQVPAIGLPRLEPTAQISQGAIQFRWGLSRGAYWQSKGSINDEIFDMFKSIKINQIIDIGQSVSPDDSSIQIIYENSIPDFAEHFLPGEINIRVAANVYVEQLTVYAQLSSLFPATFPEFTASQTRAEQQRIAAEFEWTSPRYVLKLLKSIDGNAWVLIGRISLIRLQESPDRIYNFLALANNGEPLKINANTKLGIQVEDAGSGLLENTDICNVSGSIIQEINLVQSGLNLLV